MRALKLFKGLRKAVGLVETSLAPCELAPPKEFETGCARASSALLLPPRTGMSRAAEGIVEGNKERGDERILGSEESEENHHGVSYTKRLPRQRARVTVQCQSRPWKSSRHASDHASQRQTPTKPPRDLMAGGCGLHSA